MALKLANVSSQDYIASGMLPDEVNLDNFYIRFLPWRFPPRSDGTVSEFEAKNGRPHALFARIHGTRRDGEEWRPINLRVGPLQYFLPCNIDENGNPVLPAAEGEAAYEALCTVDESGEPLARIEADEANGISLLDAETAHEGVAFACVCDDEGNALRETPDRSSGWAQFLRALETVTGKYVGDGQVYDIYDGLSIRLSSVPSENKSSKRNIHVPTALLSGGGTVAAAAAAAAAPAKPAPPAKPAAAAKKTMPPAKPATPVPAPQPAPASAPSPAAAPDASAEDVELVNNTIVTLLAETGGKALKTSVLLKALRLYKEADSSTASAVMSNMFEQGGGEGWTLTGQQLELTDEMKEALGLA